MLTGKNFMIVGFVVVVFVILQGILVSVGKVDNPAEAAVDFTKAYFMLDGATMSELLCNEIVEDEDKMLDNEGSFSKKSVVKRKMPKKK